MSNTLNYNLERLSDARDNIAQAIKDKGGTVSNLDGFEDFPNDIRSIPTGSSSVLDKLKEIEIVRFFDWDGTLLHKYTKDEFLALDSLPENPNNPNMISQGWNWTLSDAKDYVQTYGMLDIGQYAKWDWNSFATQDQLNGITTINFDVTSSFLSYYIYIRISLGSGSTVTIDWGDGTITDTDITYHKYTSIGNYTIKIHVNGTFYMTNDTINTWSPILCYYNNDWYRISYNSIELGYNITSLPDAAFRGLSKLQSIILPPSIVTSPKYVFNGCSNLIDIKITGDVTTVANCHEFNGCYKLKSIAFPSTITTRTETSGYMFNSCRMLKYVTLLPLNNYGSNPSFSSCYNLTNISVAKTTNLGYGTNLFDYCQHLEKLTSYTNVGASTNFSPDILVTPQPYSSINYNSLSSKILICNKLYTATNAAETVVIRGNTSSTQLSFSISTSNNDGAVQKIRSLIIDDSNVTSLSLSNIQLLEELIIINSSITSLSISGCYKLNYMDIPSGVSTINSTIVTYVMNELTTIKFMNSTPPTLASQFTPARNDLKIYIPQGSLSAYTSATNYPSTDVCEYIEY